MMNISLFAALLVCVCVCVCVSESCTCFPTHPQQLFCSSSIVMQAKVTGKKNIPRESNEDDMVQYDIKVMKVFRGSSERIKQIKHAYTNEIMCGAILGNGQHLLSGYVDTDSRLFTTMCDFNMSWHSLSLKQKNNIKYRYPMGCDCKISICTRQPCQPSSRSECVWDNRSSPWSEPFQDSACFRHSDGSCNWYTGTSKNHTHI